MTVLSTKKPPNTNKDSTANQQPPIPPATTRARSSRDEEHAHGAAIPTDSASESNTASNEPPEGATSGAYSMVTTSQPIFSNNSKRKSHNHHQHHHQHPFPQTLTKQARRRRPSVEGNRSAHSNSSSSNEDDLADNQVASSLRATTTSSNQPCGEADQCNSEDEYDHTTVNSNRNNPDEREMRFVRTLKEKKGFVIKPVQEDGACLFRAVSDQVFGDEEMHMTVRQNCMDYIVKNADFFREYITEDFEHYVSRKRRQNCHGNHIEMIALSELYNRPIEVYEYGTEPINVVHGMYKTDNEPIRLSYHSGIHYNSVVDPWRPTAGHGLGLPDLEPGRAQQALIVTALRQSEESHIERAMLDDKLAATDWEATQDELLQQIARESYRQWLRDTNQRSKDDQMAASASSSAATSEGTFNTAEASSSQHSLPLKLDERNDCQFALPFQYDDDRPTNSGFADGDDDDDDDDSLMRQVLAMSQIEYVETLTKQQPSTVGHLDPSPSSTETGLS